MSLLSLVKGRRGKSGFGFASTAEEVTQGIDLAGKTAVITGVSSGLGQETARVLGLRGAHIVGAARTAEKAEEACRAVDTGTTPVVCELSEVLSVDACVGQIADTGREIDLLICNAGIMALPTLEQKHGLELQFLTNHIGHFALIHGLLPRLARGARVVLLSSYGHRLTPKAGIDFENLSGDKGYSKWRAYGQSKLANLLTAVALSDKLVQSGQAAHAAHPGVIRTNLGRHMGGVTDVLYGASAPLFTKSVAQGAATTCYAATHPDLAGQTGLYFADCNVREPSAHGRDRALASRLWDESLEIVNRIRESSSNSPHV